MLELFLSRRPRVALTLLCLLLWTPGFFSLPPGDRDESRFVQATKQMLETGDYVRIMNGTEARNRKPIGIHWLQVPFVAAAHAAGLAQDNPVWPYRIPSALGAWAAVLAIFAAGVTLFDRRTALLAAAMLAACAVLVTEVHIAKTDAALLGAVTIAMAVLARAATAGRGGNGPGDPPLARAGVGRGAAAVFWLALGASILLKGPVGPMVVGLAALTLSISDRRARWLLALRPGWGVPLMLLLVLPWFVAIGLATEGRFFADAVGGDLGRKLSSGDDAHGGWPGLHTLLAPALLFPTTAALPGALLLGWRQRTTPAVRFLLAWLVPAWLVFELVPTKLPHYTLPLYPALCLLGAAALMQGLALPRVARVLAAGLPAVIGVALAIAAAWVPVLLGGPPFVPGLVLVILGTIPAILALSPNWMAVATVGSVLIYGTVLGYELPHLRPLWLAPSVVAALLPGTTLGAVGFAEPSLMFLAGTGTRWLDPAGAAAALAGGSVGALVVSDRDLDAVLAATGPLRTIATIPGYNVSRGRRVTLTVLTR